MDPLILSYLQAEERLRIAREKVASSLALAREDARPTGALRVATAKDIVPGALLWYPETSSNELFWAIVEESYGNGYYCAHDGCNYDIDGAMIEVPDHITKD